MRKGKVSQSKGEVQYIKMRIQNLARKANLARH
jgi:hypothetical protein